MNKADFNTVYNPDYKSFCNVIRNLDSSLNSRKDRFDKASLIEMGFAKATRDALCFVDLQGIDLEDKTRGLKFEIKSAQGALITGKGKRKKQTLRIKLTNTLQQGDNKKLEPKSDFLIIIDSSKHVAVAIVDYALVAEKYSKELKDGFDCQIPAHELEFLYVAEPSPEPLREGRSYAEKKAEMMSEYLAPFFQKSKKL